MEIDNWSYFEALTTVKELGYVGGVKLWWRVGKCEGKYEYKSITRDSHALEMANYANDGQQVTGMNREDKGKAVEVGDERRGPIEAIDTDSGSEESIDGSLEDFCFDYNERKGTLPGMMDLVKLRCRIWPLRKLLTLKEFHTLRRLFILLMMDITVKSSTVTWI
ncbi:hypothetical protein SESBI_26266 [Sesbania bispinosa]|nr:hypothetical protein SESBI_26266 [Sesbania bispinosa]